MSYSGMGQGDLRPNIAMSRTSIRAACLLLLGTVVTRAAEPPVTAVAFTPIGKTVVTGSQSGIAIRTWPELQTVAEIVTQLEQIHDIRISPVGQYAAVAGGSPAESGEVEIWDLSSQKFVHRLGGHDDVVYAVDWSEDGQQLLTASLDRVCQVVDISKRQVVRAFEGHSRGVTSAVFLPGTEFIVTASIDQSVRVWNVTTGQLVRSLNNHTQPIHRLAVRPENEGNLPMTATVSDDRTVRFWQPTIGRMVRFARFESSIPLDCCWLAGGKLLAVACDDGHIRVISPDTAAIVHDEAVFDGWLYSVAAHPRGEGLAVGGEGGIVKRVTLAVE